MAGVSNSEATLLAVFIYALLSLNGLIGGAIYLWDRRQVVPALSSQNEPRKSFTTSEGT